MKKSVNWDSFNVDNALDEIDQKNALEEIALNANDILKSIEREDFEATLFATRKAADAMRSKAAVIALKEKRNCKTSKVQADGQRINIFQSPIGTSQVVSLDTTASLALELSVGMDTINENLNSLSEKVKSLRISIINSLTQRSTRTDLRDGLSFLSAVQDSKSKRSNMDSVIKRILTINDKIESLSKASSGIHSGEIVFEGNIDLNDEHVNGKKERECRLLSGTEPLNITAAATTLESVDRSLLNMQLFASRFITIIAVSQGEFSLSCDMSRHYLKLLEAQGDLQADDVMMWMLRGLSLAGLGSGYLANIHFRRVKKLQPNCPNINNLLEYLDQYEMRQALQYQSESLEMSIISELLRIEKRCRAMQDVNDNMFEISAKGGISVTQMNRFLGEADDVDAMAPINLNNFSTLHVMKQPGRFDDLDLSDVSIDDVILCGICSDDNNVIFKDASQKVSVDDVIAKISMLKFANHIKVSSNIFETALSRCDILQLARSTFYEGQLLFIERLLYSAEIKYLTAYLLAEAAVRKQEKDVKRNQMQDPLICEETNSDIFLNYATSLKSYSIMNTALCRSHRFAKKDKNYSENSTKSDDDAAITNQSTPGSAADKFTRQDISLADQCMYLSGFDTIELMNSFKMDPGSVTLRFRRVAVLEKLMKYEKALEELDLLQVIALDALTKSSCVLEEPESQNFHSMFDEIHGSTDSTTKDFSQKHLFADFFYPTVHSHSRSDNVSHKKSNHGSNISILHEIRNKKRKIEFLKRRFG